MNIEKVSSLVRQITNAEEVCLTDTNDYPQVVDFGIRNDPDNYVLGLRWYDDVGNEYAYDFTEQNLSDAEITCDGVIEVTNDDGECFPIQMLNNKTVFPVADWD